MSNKTIDYSAVELWECLGCGYTDALQAVNAHVLQSATWADGTLRDIADVVCTGAVRVDVDGDGDSDVFTDTGLYDMMRTELAVNGHPCDHHVECCEDDEDIEGGDTP
jgi:hypothetical protein